MINKAQIPSQQGRSWRADLPIHPAAELFPVMTPDELKVLGKDIIKNGLTSSIALWRADPKAPAQLLDGRNRLDAIEMVTGKPVVIGTPSVMAGEEFLATGMVIELDGRKVDPWIYASSANVLRRHLTAEEKREVIAKFLKAQPEKSDRQIGKMAEADKNTAAAVRRDLEARGEIHHVKTRTDAKGRQQPATKATRKAQEKKPAEEKSESKPVEPVTVTTLKVDGGATGIGEVERLRAENAALKAENAALKAEITALRAKYEAPAVASSEVPVTPSESASANTTAANTVIAGDAGPMPDILRRKPKADAPDSNGGTALGDVLTEAFGEMGALAEECADSVERALIYDCDRTKAQEEAAETLGELSAPDIAPELASIKVKLPKHRKPRTRSDRLDVALGDIGACQGALNKIGPNDPRHQKACALSGALQEAFNEAEQCAQ